MQGFWIRGLTLLTLIWRDKSGGLYPSFDWDTIGSIGVNLTIEKAVETAAIQPKPACAGFKALDFWLVRLRGLGMQ